MSVCLSVCPLTELENCVGHLYQIYSAVTCDSIHLKHQLDVRQLLFKFIQHREQYLLSNISSHSMQSEGKWYFLLCNDTWVPARPVYTGRILRAVYTARPVYTVSVYRPLLDSSHMHSQIAYGHRLDKQMACFTKYKQKQNYVYTSYKIFKRGSSTKLWYQQYSTRKS